MSTEGGYHQEYSMYHVDRQTDEQMDGHIGPLFSTSVTIQYTSGSHSDSPQQDTVSSYQHM